MPAGARSSGPAILTPSPAVRPSGHRPGPIDPYGYAAARYRRVAFKLKPPPSLSPARDADLRLRAAANQTGVDRAASVTAQ